MTAAKSALSYKAIFLFWLPLAATWLMMSLENPFLSAVIARLAETKNNLAAYGVAFSLALFVEAPIIMIMSAATALVSNRDSYIKLRNFTYSLNGIITALNLFILIPPVFDILAVDIINLPPRVAELTYAAVWILLPWPAAIGFRRFYQGILIREGLTRYVAYGTVVRLGGGAIAALSLYAFSDAPGVVVGASGLSVGVMTEAIASRFMVNRSINRLLASGDTYSRGRSLSYRYIIRYYTPLMATAFIAMAIHPLVSLFVGQSKMALESLAVLPVISSFIFLFRSFGMAYQEVGIALMGERFEQFDKLARFAFMLGLGTVSCLAAIVFSPAFEIWFGQVVGLSPALTDFALLPTMILTVFPALTALISLQRAVLMVAHTTRPVISASVMELAVAIMCLFLAIHVFDAVGAVAASLALLLGRFAAILVLFPPYFRVRNSRAGTQAQ